MLPAHGSVFTRGKRKVWYGMFREDVRTSAGMRRRRRLVRLGTLAELPTKNAARNKLFEFMNGCSPPSATGMTFDQLAERWEAAEGPTMKVSTLSHYTNALRAYVLPSFGKRTVTSITREDIQRFLADKAKTYSLSTLRSMRVALSLTLGGAEANSWVPRNPCAKVKLPKETAGRCVARTVLAPEQINGIAEKLEEPYATLVLFLAATGLRIGEAIAIKWSDFDGNVLRVSRRILNGEVGKLKSQRSERRLPLEARMVERVRTLGEGHDWVFRSAAGTPINPGNALKRYMRPAATELGLVIGGWHDFRHTLSTRLRRAGVHPKVVSDILGHKKVSLAMDVYDRTDVQDFVQPLAAVATELLSSAINSGKSA